MRYNVWHNDRGLANQYFICKGTKVLFQIPNFIGKLFLKKGVMAWILKKQNK